MEPIHAWTCPRCGAKPDHPHECACGLSRCGWLTGLLEYRYRVERGEAFVSIGQWRTSTSFQPIAECPEGKSRGCEECEFDGEHFGPVESYEGARYDLK